MKASEEIAADMFIRDCIRRGITNHRHIVEEARQAKGTGSQKVEELLQKGKSKSYDDIKAEECPTCESPLMYDDSQSEFYCPICDS